MQASMASLAKNNLFKISSCFFVIVFGILMYLASINFVNGAIVNISKRGKFNENSNVKTYCMISEREGDESHQTFLKINCSTVPGPVRKLSFESDYYLKLNSGYYIAPTEFCALESNPNFGKLCPSHSDPLWKKCCPANEVLDATSFTCHRSRLRYRPKVKGSSVPQSFIVQRRNSSLVTLGGLQCGPGLVPRIYSSVPCLAESLGSFQLASNGTPMYQASIGVFLRKTQLKPVEQDSYCVDGLWDFSSSFLSPCNLVKSHHEKDENDYNRHKGHHHFDKARCQSEMGEVLLVCMEEQDTISNEDGDEKGIPKAYFFAALWLSTCPLLVIAAIANSCVIQKNVHGWILTSYLMSMFLVNINSVILILDITPSPHIASSSSLADAKSFAAVGGCRILDFTMKYIYMSTLCWMTSMNFGLFKTFSSNVPQAVAPQRFILSALFSCGFPIFAVSISYYMGSLPVDEAGGSGGAFSAIYYHVGSNNVNVNNTKSFPSSKAAIQSGNCQTGSCPLYSYKTIPYYYGPVVFLVLCNVAAFLKTSTTIASLRRQAEAVLHKQAKDHLESFTLFAKLFLLTGSIWIIRVILLVLQTQGLYVTWYGVVLEAVFSIPEIVFPLIIFHHPEFIKWTWRKSPAICRVLFQCNPFCKKESIFKEGNSLELQSANQMSCTMHQQRGKQAIYLSPKSSQVKTDFPGDTTTKKLVIGRTITITTFTTVSKSVSIERK